MIMHRMTMDDMEFPSEQENPPITALTESSKWLFDNQHSQRGKLFAQFSWDNRLEAIQAGRYFAIIENNEIASSSFVSDIDHKAGNIVVGTKPKYRKMGYGRALVQRSTEWCFENGIRPIYLVDVQNTPSAKLAEGLGYKTMTKEAIVSSYTRN